MPLAMLHTVHPAYKEMNLKTFYKNGQIWSPADTVKLFLVFWLNQIPTYLAVSIPKEEK